jgi:hypothetical protein
MHEIARDAVGVVWVLRYLLQSNCCRLDHDLGFSECSQPFLKQESCGGDDCNFPGGVRTCLYAVKATGPVPPRALVRPRLDNGPPYSIHDAPVEHSSATEPCSRPCRNPRCSSLYKPCSPPCRPSFPARVFLAGMWACHEASITWTPFVLSVSAPHSSHLCAQACPLSFPR